MIEMPGIKASGQDSKRASISEYADPKSSKGILYSRIK